MKYTVALNGKQYEVEVSETEAVLLGVTDIPTASFAAPAAAAAPAPAAASAPAAAAAPAAPIPAPATGTASASVAEGKVIAAPMPGTILNVKVNIGHPVKRGDVLFVLEAMKMENDIVAPDDGVVKQILVSKGDTVNTEDVLGVI